MTDFKNGGLEAWPVGLGFGAFQGETLEGVAAPCDSDALRGSPYIVRELASIRRARRRFGLTSWLMAGDCQWCRRASHARAAARTADAVQVGAGPVLGLLASCSERPTWPGRSAGTNGVAANLKPVEAQAVVTV